MFHLGEFEGAVQAVEGDGEIGRTGDGLGLWREAKQSSGPGCGAGNCGIVREVGQRRGTGRPGLGEAVPERDAEGAGSSSLLGYLGERKEAPPPVAPAPGVGEAAAALFGCPRSVLEDLLRAATAKADVVSSLEIEREVLTLCAERQVLVVTILEAEAELARLWQESRGPAPEAVRPEPGNVLAQLTEFQGEPVVEFVEEPVEPEPEPEPEAELPSYGWFSIFGTAGDLRAGVRRGFHAGDAVLLDLLGGVIPGDAERLVVEGGSYETRAWRHEGDVLMVTGTGRGRWSSGR